MKTYVYRFDEIDYSLNIGSQDPNMFDKGKRTIFNCEVPWSKWKRPPKIGDTITMLNAAPDGYPWKIVQIKINGEIVYDEIKNNFIIPIDNTVLCAVIESTTGYSCPNCGAICSDKTLISRTEAEFEELPDPHYSWVETHKCQKCETLYLLHNGT
mgnify:CR=1 FL=1